MCYFATGYSEPKVHDQVQNILQDYKRIEFHKMYMKYLAQAIRYMLLEDRDGNFEPFTYELVDSDYVFISKGSNGLNKRI